MLYTCRDIQVANILYPEELQKINAIARRRSRKKRNGWNECGTGRQSVYSGYLFESEFKN
jgi:hypothetical protein